MTTQPQLRLIDVSKRYANGKPVLDKFSLDIARGDFVAFIGPKGCGKSTILRLIAGLTPLTGGQVEHLADVPEHRRASFVFQESALLPWRTVEDNVRLPLQLRGIGADQQRELTADNLKLWGLTHVSARYPLQLTGGMKVRTSLARAMITQPACLLLDEPFTALDAMTRNKLSAELMRLREKQHFVGCLVSHSAAEAVFLANRVVVLEANPGRILKVVDVPQPYPRKLEWRETDDFQDAVTQVRGFLNQAEENAKSA